MATIYRFIVEQRVKQVSDGRKPRETTSAKKSVAKQGRNVSFFGGDRGGVEHNRKMRAINPLLNRMTGGIYEKAVRGARAVGGLANNVKESGLKGVLTGPALYILVALAITLLLQWQKSEMVKARKMNAQNFKQMENGIGAIRSQYEITTNFWTGQHTYNQNK